MIVSKLKMEFPAARWASKTSGAARRMFDQVVTKNEKILEEVKPMERMSLGELLYFVLSEQGVQA